MKKQDIINIQYFLTDLINNPIVNEEIKSKAKELNSIVEDIINNWEAKKTKSYIQEFSSLIIPIIKFIVEYFTPP